MLPAHYLQYIGNQLPGAWIERLAEGAKTEGLTSVRLHPGKTGTLPYPAAPVRWCAQGRVLASRPSFTLDPRWHAGAYYVQEAGSMAVAEAVKALLPANAQAVLDLCAAPGGKSTHLTTVLPPGCLLVANEVIKSRVARLEENLERWGLPAHAVTQLDPAYIGKQAAAMFDAIVMDAPCSGEGLFRKDPAAIAEWSPEHVEFCAARQQRILADIWPALRPGGLLIYSTCTLNTAENEGVLAFAEVQLGAAMVPLPAALLHAGLPSEQFAGAVRFLPDGHGTEGQFVAALLKGGSADHVTELSHKKKGKPPLRLAAPKGAAAGALAALLPGREAEDFFVFKETVRLLGQAPKAVAEALLAKIPVVSLGIGVAEQMAKGLLPLQGLATLAGPPPGLPSADLTEQDALAYLHKDDLRGRLDLPAGIYVATYQGLGLGLLKAIAGGRINNLLPLARRIRMDIDA